MERIKRYTLKLLAAFLACMLLLSAASLVVLNSGALDHLAKDRAISLFEKKFFGRLEVHALNLRFPNNVTLINPRIYALGEKTPALEARTISLRLNFLSLLQPDFKNIYLRRLSIDSLGARIIEQPDGKINLVRIFTSREPDSTKSPKYFFFKTLQITNSYISFLGKPGHQGNEQLGLKDINLGFSELSVNKKLLKGKLEQLRFKIPKLNFFLKDASGQFLFSETRSEVLVLKAASNKSHAELSATIDHFNIFSRQRQKGLALSTSFLNLQELALDSDELRIFFPALIVPHGIYTLKGNIRGNKDNLEIIDALLTNLTNKISAKGHLFNLQNKNAYAFTLKCDSSKISAPLIESLLKESALKKFARNSGDITFFGSAKGTLNAVKTDISTLSAAGEASLSAETSMEKSGQLTSRGTMALKGFKPHLFMNSERRKGLVNATGSFEVKVSNKELHQLQLQMKLTDSYWQNQPVKEGTISLNYENRILNSALFLKNNLTIFAFDSKIDWGNESPHYSASGKASMVDISKILDSREFTTDLSGLFSMQGSGFQAGTVNFAGIVQFSPSTINNIELKEHSKVSVEIIQNSGASKVNLKSDFLDIFAEGNYSFDDLISLGKLATSGISREITTQNIWHTNLQAPAIAENSLKKPFTVNYHIAVKDISLMAQLLPVQHLTLQGSADGRAEYLNGECSINSAVNLASLRFHDNFFLDNLLVQAEIRCSSSGTSAASVNGKASSISLSGKKTGNAIFSTLYTPSRLEATFDVAIPTPAQSMLAKFSVAKSESRYDLSIDHLSLKEDTGIWKTIDNSHIMLSKTSASFNHFTIAKGMQQAIFDGELSNSQPGSFQCTLSNIELNELTPFAYASSLDKLAGTINASLTVSGAPGSKTSSLNITGVNIRYDNVAIGPLQGNALHLGNQLRFEVHGNTQMPANMAKRADSALNTIEGNGTIPLVLSYYPLQFHTTEQQAISASFRSDNLSAQFLEYLSPLFASVEGIIPIRLQIEGKTPNPDIYLSATLHNTKIKIEPTQVSYRLNGEVHITAKALELRDVTISDNLNGNGRINGVVRLEKLKPTELDLAGKFDKLLLFNKNDMQDETSFGSITGTTNNILAHGNLSAPVIEGELRIDAADFSLYRSGANESTKYVGIDKFIEFTSRYHPANTIESENRVIPAKTTEFYHSLIDILQIKKLRLSSIEPLKYTMIFDRNRGEQLETSINNLALIIDKNNQQYSLFGSVNIIGGKYNFSNSNFDLQNGGKITWNNVDIRSGAIENLYGSKYVSASSQQTGERDNVNLLLAMTGTLNDPQVSMGYYLNEQTQPYASANMIGGQSSQIDPNAELNVISMLLSKQWYAKPGSTGQTGNIAVSSVGFSAGTGILSSRISKVIQDFGGLESFNVNVGMDNRGALGGLDLYFALRVPGTDGKIRFIGTGSSPSIGGTTFSDYYGTAQKIEYRITPKVYLEAFRSFGQNGGTTTSSNLQKPAETWGISLAYKERFHTWDELWKRLVPSSDKKQ